MALIQYIFDDFADNSIDPIKWVIGVGSTLQTESGGKLNTPCAANANPTTMYTKNNYYDLTKGRLAVKFSRAGTTDSNVYTYWGLRDVNGAGFTFFNRSNDATMQQATNSAGTGTFTQTETTVGLGPSWVANTWLGIIYTTATSTYSIGKSTDGVTWTEIAKFVVSAAGSFLPHQAGLFVGCTSYGTVTNFTPSWDDVSYFATDTLLRTKVRSGGAWVSAYPRVRVASAWKRPIVKVRQGGLWVRPQ